MKKLITIVLLLCCFTMIFGLVACKPQGDPSGEQNGENSEGNNSGNGGGAFFFNEDGTVRYKVIRPDTNNVDVKNAAVSMRHALIEVFETEVGISDDWVDDPNMTDELLADQYEILIGATNRPESEQVYETLGEYSYKICIIGHKIVIVGSDGKATAQAAQ